MGHAVQCDGLVQQFVAGGPLNLQRQVVPGIIVGVAGNAGRDPTLADIIPDIPNVAAGYFALGAPDEAHPAEELIDIEFQRL